LFPRRTRSLCSLILAAAACWACAPGPEKAAAEVVRRYNEALRDAYLRPDADLVARYTTPGQRTRVAEYINYLLKHEKLLRCELHELTIVETRVEDSEVSIRTEEHWTCADVSSETRLPVEAEEIFHQEVLYRLVLQEGQWLIAGLDVVTPSPSADAT
jgi:hypothetical protein